MVSETKRRTLRAYPKSTSVICMMSGSESIKNLCRELSESDGIEESSLIFSGGLCLGLKVRTRGLATLLPKLCEHGDAVCVGKSYPEILSEHGTVLIKSGALIKLSAKSRDGGGHVLGAKQI